MRIIGMIKRFIAAPPTFVMTKESSEALAEGCRKAAQRHVAQPKKLVVVRASARHIHFARVAA